MRYICVIFLTLGCATLISTESGFYVPKLFYTLDSTGKIDLIQHLNSERNLRRFKRTSVSSTSSSSSVTAPNGVQYFTNTGTAANDYYGTYLTSSGLVVPPGQIYITDQRSGQLGK